MTAEYLSVRLFTAEVYMIHDDLILLSYGSGGKKTGALIEELFMKHLGNSFLEKMEDAAVVPFGFESIVFSTDSFTVNPIFFPGGNIGELSVHGTVNDIAMMGGKPLYLSLGFIIEEGFPVSDLERIVISIGDAARKCGVKIVTGDTKVVEKGSCDKIFINTSGVGKLIGLPLTPDNISVGDNIIVTGTIGDHGLAVMLARSGAEITSASASDTAGLNGLTEKLLTSCGGVKAMRDPTRGGLATTLVEIAEKTGLNIEVSEERIPVSLSVNSGCELLGFDPLYLANEGKALIFVHSDNTEEALGIIRAHELGRNAALIGSVTAESAGIGQVVLRTSIGGRRIIRMLEGDQYPRIC